MKNKTIPVVQLDPFPQPKTRYYSPRKPPSTSRQTKYPSARRNSHSSGKSQTRAPSVANDTSLFSNSPQLRPEFPQLRTKKIEFRKFRLTTPSSKPARKNFDENGIKILTSVAQKLQEKETTENFKQLELDYRPFTQSGFNAHSWRAEKPWFNKRFPKNVFSQKIHYF